MSSCRIFQRQVSSLQEDQHGLFAGGIGEVCTDKNHRKTRSFQTIVAKCNSNHDIAEKMKLSLLHAALQNSVQSIEKGGGYESVTSQWSVVTLIRSNLQEAAIPYTTRLATFPQDTARLQADSSTIFRTTLCRMYPSKSRLLERIH